MYNLMALMSLALATPAEGWCDEEETTAWWRWPISTLTFVREAGAPETVECGPAGELSFVCDACCLTSEVSVWTKETNADPVLILELCQFPWEYVEPSWITSPGWPWQ